MLNSAIPVTCGHCNRSQRAKPEFAGRRGKCPGCGHAISIPFAAMGPTVIDTTDPRQLIPAAWLSNPKLRSQLLAGGMLLLLLVVFGRDWLPATQSGGGKVTPSVRKSSTTVRSSRAAAPDDPSVAPEVEKLPLGTASASADGTTGIAALLPPSQPMVTRRELPLDCPLANGVRSAVFSPDGAFAMTIHQTERGAYLRKWVATTGAAVGQPVRLPEANEFQVTFTPDGQRLAMTAASAEHGLTIINARNGTVLKSRATNRQSRLTAPAWNGDGKILYGTPHGTIESWDLIADAAGPALSQGQPVTRVAVSDGGYLLSGDQSGEIRLWSTEGGQYAASYRALKGPIRVLETRRYRDGVLVFAVAGDFAQAWHAHLFDLQTLKTLHSLSFSGPVTSLALAPDWRRVVTGHRGGKISVWETVAGDEIETTPVHTGDVTTLSISPDNSAVMSGCHWSPEHQRDVTVRLRPLPPLRSSKRTETSHGLLATEGTAP